MSRRLSNPEWIAFQNAVNVPALGLPPWGGVVEWNGQLILVYICQADGSLCRKGEVMLTDVSDHAELLANMPRTYDVNSGTWTYHYGAEFQARFYEVAKGTLETTGEIIQAVANAVGGAAGGLTKPLLENLYIPLIVIGVIFLWMETGKR